MYLIVSNDTIDQKEQQFIDEYADRLQFNHKKVNKLINFTKKRILLQMPEDNFSYKMVYPMMEEAAMADNFREDEKKFIIENT